MAYAQGTKVEVAQTRVDIERILERYGAASFSWHVEPMKAALQFTMNKRFVRFKLPLPEPGNAKQERLRREKWCALLLVVKAKLESVEAGIETFEESFLAHIIMPDSATVGEHALPAIADAYKSGKMPDNLLSLPAPKS